MIATAAVTVAMLAIGAGGFALRKSPSLRAATASGKSRLVIEQVVEDCNRYAAATERDAGRIVRDGPIGAGVGAGIGAFVGATIGALRGLSEENGKTETARAAYADCLARRGY